MKPSVTPATTATTASPPGPGGSARDGASPQWSDAGLLAFLHSTPGRGPSEGPLAGLLSDEVRDMYERIMDTSGVTAPLPPDDPFYAPFRPVLAKLDRMEAQLDALLMDAVDRRKKKDGAPWLAAIEREAEEGVARMEREAEQAAAAQAQVGR